MIEQQGKVGKPVTITCKSEGLPEPSYRITRDGTVVSTGKMYFISEAAMNDEGTYTCIATNKLGSDSASAYLAVTGKIRSLTHFITMNFAHSITATGRKLAWEEHRKENPVRIVCMYMRGRRALIYTEIYLVKARISQKFVEIK